MAYNQPFSPQGNTVKLQTNGTANTVNSTQIQASDFGMSVLPNQYMLISNATADIWVVFATTAAIAAAAAFPTAGTTTPGTAQPGFRLKPGVIMVVTFGANPLYVGNISTGVSQSFDITPGEGS